MMNITEIKENRDAYIEVLTELWERSVKATHDFLSADEIAAIKEYVPQALGGVPVLVVACSEQQVMTAFLGLDGGRIEMLFVSPDERGKGIGKALIQQAVERYGAWEVTVNEQNPQAVGFYERMGFTVYKRSDLDEQGNHYPLLYMKLPR
ncbi:acetyltransferase [uncultured Megasphaera sp.]|uniref:acetyltransferase n=1 Tax=uncultured Megasphaera sp. TaxID=165188 RepID=UPI002597FA9B|nr:acetyltransferase [uncultured Megasphaera sp.]